MKDFNELENAAQARMQSGDYRNALNIYLFMADGDPSLDGGYLAEQIGRCYEAMGDLFAAKYWYGRALEENPEVRIYSAKARERLSHLDITEII